MKHRAPKFWHPQHAQRLVLMPEDSSLGPGLSSSAMGAVPDAAAEEQQSKGGSAVMLIGDAAHVFPPGMRTPLLAAHSLCCLSSR